MKFTPTRLLIALALMFAPLAVAACQVPNTDVTLTAPTVANASVQQNAYAVLKTYAEVAKEAATIVEDPNTPETVKTILATAVLNTEKPALAVTDAFAAYDRKQGEIKARLDAKQSVPAILFTEAGDLYATAMKLYDEHKDALSSFPGLVKAVRMDAAL